MLDNVLDNDMMIDITLDNQLDMSRPQINFRISPELQEKLKLACDRQGLTISAYSLKALEYCLDNGISFIPGSQATNQIDILGSVRECQGDNNLRLEDRIKAVEARLKAVEDKLDNQLDTTLDNQLDTTLDTLDNQLDTTLDTLDNQLDTTLDNQLDTTLDTLDNQLDTTLDNQLDTTLDTLDNQLDTTSPDNQEVQEVQEDSDIHGTIRDILAINPGTSSLRGIVDLLKKNKVRIPGKGGLVQPTIQNVKPYLVDRQG